MKFTTLLPWRKALWLHKRLGRICWRLMSSRRQMVERNLAEFLPLLDGAELRRLSCSHFENLGVCLAEAAFTWFDKVDNARLEVRIEGDEHVRAALAQGRGVILYTGHFTSLEICPPLLNEIFPRFGFMFNHRRNKLIDALQENGRQRFTDRPISNDNVRGLVHALATNAVVWYAPDQGCPNRSSIELPFLGRPRFVSTSTTRLARVSGAAVIPFYYRRLPDDSGYVLHFEPEPDGVGTDDDEKGTCRITAMLENFIRECPEQYAWAHRGLR